MFERGVPFFSSFARHTSTRLNPPWKCSAITSNVTRERGPTQISSRFAIYPRLINTSGSFHGAVHFPLAYVYYACVHVYTRAYIYIRIYNSTRRVLYSKYPRFEFAHKLLSSRSRELDSSSFSVNNRIIRVPFSILLKREKYIYVRKNLEIWFLRGGNISRICGWNLESGEGKKKGKSILFFLFRDIHTRTNTDPD